MAPEMELLHIHIYPLVRLYHPPDTRNVSAYLPLPSLLILCKYLRSVYHLFPYCCTPHLIFLSFCPCALKRVGTEVVGGVGSSLTQKEMNPINQALVPVSSLPGPAAYPACCSYMHLRCCLAENPVTPFSVNVMLFFPFKKKD